MLQCCMDILTVIVSAVASTALTIPTMLLLYQCVIIPKIIDGVKKELPQKILSIVDEKIDVFRLDLMRFIQDQVERVKMSMLGSKGAKKKILDYALNYLEKYGPSQDTFERIKERYGEEALDMISQMATQKKDDKPDENQGGIVEIKG